MTTFAIALGVSGTLNYTSDYRSASDGDFVNIRCASTSGQRPELQGLAGLAGSGTDLQWLRPDRQRPSDNWNNPKSIDDFWHAAVNGRGQYFSAGEPDLGRSRA